MATFDLSFSEYVIALLLFFGSLNPPFWVQKTSHGFQQLKVRCSSNVLRFIDFSPADTNFRCVWPATTAARKCKRSLNYDRKNWANTIRNTIANESPYNQIIEKMLPEYLEFCLCHHHRPKDNAPQSSTAIIDAMLQQWMSELRALYDLESMTESQQHQAAPQLYPPTRLRDCDSEIRVQNPEYTLLMPLKHESSDVQIPIKGESAYPMPGSFPGAGLFDHTLFGNAALVSMEDEGSLRSIRPSLPRTPTPKKYRQAILESPSGITRINFTRKTSTSAPPDSAGVTPGDGLPLGAFRPYPVDQDQTLLSVLNRPLGKNESKEGYVYIFTHHSDNGSHSAYVKVGVAGDVSKRLKQWQKTCKYKPHSEHVTLQVPNAMRVELLVHTELIRHRRIEQECKGCGESHDEWIETDVATARRVVDRWTEWMEKSRPYHHEGQLASHVVRGIFENNWSKIPLTSLKMLSLTAESGLPDSQPEQSPPGPHRRVTLPSLLRPDSGSIIFRPRSEPIDGLPTRRCASDSFTNQQSIIRSASPWERGQELSDEKHGTFDILEQKRPTRSMKEDEAEESYSTNVDYYQINVKVEPKDDLDDLFMSDIEIPDSQDSSRSVSPYRKQSRPFGTALINDDPRLL